MKLIFTLKDVYGRELFYPVNSLAEELCRLAGRKTMDEMTLHRLKTAGFVIEIQERKIAV